MVFTTSWIAKNFSSWNRKKIDNLSFACDKAIHLAVVLLRRFFFGFFFSNLYDLIAFYQSNFSKITNNIQNNNHLGF